VGLHEVAVSSRAADNQGGPAAAPVDPEVIELLEIVEEGSEGVIQQARQKN
jgi:hypothetical protein